MLFRTPNEPAMSLVEEDEARNLTWRTLIDVVKSFAAQGFGISVTIRENYNLSTIFCNIPNKMDVWSFKDTHDASVPFLKISSKILLSQNDSVEYADNLRTLFIAANEMKCKYGARVVVLIEDLDVEPQPLNVVSLL